ncbi:MAG: endonuclease [Actinomycetospora sp.]|nr:endonuclease [Actinomycetospora sp.]
MVRWGRIDAVTVEDRVTAERTLAEKATVMSPRKLQEYVQALIEYFDPDGAAPPDGEDRGDELHMVPPRNGSVVFTGQWCDPVDGDAFRGVIDDLSGRCGHEDGVSSSGAAWTRSRTEIVPVVLGSASEPLDVGRLSRTVTDAIRRALNLRDGGCAPGCSCRPPATPTTSSPRRSLARRRRHGAGERQTLRVVRCCL